MPVVKHVEVDHPRLKQCLVDGLPALPHSVPLPKRPIAEEQPRVDKSPENPDTQELPFGVIHFVEILESVCQEQVEVPRRVSLRGGPNKRHKPEHHLSICHPLVGHAATCRLPELLRPRNLTKEVPPGTLVQRVPDLLGRERQASGVDSLEYVELHFFRRPFLDQEDGDLRLLDAPPKGAG